MFGLSWRLLLWNIGRSRGRTLLLVITVFCALSSFVLLGTALTEMADSVAQSTRSDWPFDIAVEGKITPEQIDQVRGLSGAYHVEAVHSRNVLLGSGVQRILVAPQEDSALTLELATGRLPSLADEITIPGWLADAFSVELGDSIKLIDQLPGEPPQEFVIAGILSGKAKVLTTPIITLEGMARFRQDTTYPNQMLIQLDGKVDIDAFSRQLTKVLPRATIQLATEDYEMAQESRSLSDSLVIGLRGLILMITAASLGVLFYLTLRDGAYQTGVLRAMGVQRAWLLVPSIMLTLLVFAAGLMVTVLALPTIALKLGLYSDQAVLMDNLYGDAGIYLLVSVASTLVVNWQFLSQPVPSLLKDAW